MGLSQFGKDSDHTTVQCSLIIKSCQKSIGLGILTSNLRICTTFKCYLTTIARRHEALIMKCSVGKYKKEKCPIIDFKSSRNSRASSYGRSEKYMTEKHLNFIGLHNLIFKISC
jgi:hypothetical protein